jgi:bifunctional DNase/RNase
MNLSRIFALAVTGLFALNLPLSAQTNATTEVLLHVKDIGLSPDGSSPVVMLTDEDEQRMLPIWVGPAEAQSIMMALRGFKTPRPLTHDLANSIISELGGKLERLTITEMRENTFHGRLTIDVNGQTKSVDCRPSDGIAMALRAKAPIVAAAGVMKQSVPVPVGGPTDETQARAIPGLNVTVQVVTPDLAIAFGINEPRGILVSASENKELKVGDIVIGVGGADVNGAAQFRQEIQKADKSKPVTLRLLREGKPMSLDLSITGK